MADRRPLFRTPWALALESIEQGLNLPGVRTIEIKRCDEGFTVGAFDGENGRYVAVGRGVDFETACAALMTSYVERQYDEDE